MRIRVDEQPQVLLCVVLAPDRPESQKEALRRGVAVDQSRFAIVECLLQSSERYREAAKVGDVLTQGEAPVDVQVISGGAR